MTTYGMVVEGPYDAAALSEIIQKCLPSRIELTPRPCGGRDQLMKNFRGFLEEFRHVKQGACVDKALVIRDADNKDPGELLEKMRGKIVGRTYPFEVKLLVIAQGLETWLLADEEGISKVTQARSGTSVARVNENLESLAKPKEKLKGILSGTKVPYTPEVARDIAAHADLSKIEYRCPRFREFRQAVIDC